MMSSTIGQIMRIMALRCLFIEHLLLQAITLLSSLRTLLAEQPGDIVASINNDNAVPVTYVLSTSLSPEHLTLTPNEHCFPQLNMYQNLPFFDLSFRAVSFRAVSFRAVSF